MAGTVTDLSFHPHETNTTAVMAVASMRESHHGQLHAMLNPLLLTSAHPSFYCIGYRSMKRFSTCTTTRTATAINLLHPRLQF
jgi:hypothetical protein